MSIIKVVCGIIWQEGKVFIAKKKQGKPQEGKWEFPGGKVEPGEEAGEALLRELREELGMNADLGEYFFTNIHHYENISIELKAYHVKYLGWITVLSDHDEYHWVSIQELVKYDFAAADLPIVKKLIRENL